jgi:hypothetical protein
MELSARHVLFGVGGTDDAHEVDKGEFAEYLESLSHRIDLANHGYEANYGARTELYADLAHAAGALGRVFDDANPAYKGVYLKSGASGSGEWTWIAPLSGDGALASKDSVGADDLDDEAVATAKLADKAVTFGKMQDIPTDTLVGRDAAGTGAPTTITVGDGLEFTGSNGLRLANAAQGTVKMRRPGAGTGVPTDVSLADLKTDLGIGDIDNTADAAKPISDATQSALDDKADKVDVDDALEDLADATAAALENKADKATVNAALDDKADSVAVNAALEDKADDNAVVKLTGPQTIDGEKTFSAAPRCRTPRSRSPSWSARRGWTRNGRRGPRRPAPACPRCRTPRSRSPK